jgi:hypothetical protein
MVLVTLQGVKNVDELHERYQEEAIISSSHRSAPQGIHQVSRKPSDSSNLLAWISGVLR